jgi:GNAT superfamily N-acetyltransferase
VTIRESTRDDFDGLMRLYTYLHDAPAPERTPRIERIWRSIQEDPGHHIIVAEEDGRLVSSCVCVIIPNLTHDQRPYAFVENVVTDPAYRKRGLATQCLHAAREIARKENAYKLMLMTGSRRESTLRFYEQAGYNQNEKTAFVQWIEAETEGR